MVIGAKIEYRASHLVQGGRLRRCSTHSLGLQGLSMSIPRSEWQEICGILCSDDPSLLGDIELAQEHPSQYLETFEDSLFERGIEDASEVRPWLALVDGLISRQLCTEVDWKIDANELAFQLGKLKSLSGCDQLLMRLSESGTTNEEALERASNLLKEKSFSILQLDIDSDSYPLVVVHTGQQNEIERLAASLGERAVAY